MRERPPREHASWVVRGEMFDEQGAIVAVDGELDLATAPQLGAVIAEMISYGHRHLVIDLSAATFLDSVAMQTLLTALQPLRSEPTAGVVIAGGNGVVSRALLVSGVGEMFSTFDTRDAAISAVTGTGESLRHTWRQVRRPYPMT